MDHWEENNLTRQQQIEFILDLIHRTVVHYTLWLWEVEHQMGMDKALGLLEKVRIRDRSVLMRRLSGLFGFAQTSGIPGWLDNRTPEELTGLIEGLAKNWLASDGIWFQVVEDTYGMYEAKRCNDSVWARFAPFEAWSIQKMLNLNRNPGLEGLAKAIPFKADGRINKQSFHWESAHSLVYTIHECRVQAARRRKGLAAYPCKSVGLVEYTRFAEAIDDRIQTQCIGCPPDIHPEEWFCAWRFTLN